MVFHRSLVDWRRGEISLPWVYVHFAIYEILCHRGVAEIYCQLNGVESVCHGYICILLYVKIIWCSGFPEIYAQLKEGWGKSATGIYAYCYI